MLPRNRLPATYFLATLKARRDELGRIESSAESKIKATRNLAELEGYRIQFLGRERGALALILRRLKELPPNERAETGRT